MNTQSKTYEESTHYEQKSEEITNNKIRST